MNKYLYCHPRHDIVVCTMFRILFTSTTENVFAGNIATCLTHLNIQPRIAHCPLVISILMELIFTQTHSATYVYLTEKPFGAKVFQLECHCNKNSFINVIVVSAIEYFLRLLCFTCVFGRNLSAPKKKINKKGFSVDICYKYIKLSDE